MQSSNSSKVKKNSRKYACVGGQHYSGINPLERSGLDSRFQNHPLESPRQDGTLVSGYCTALPVAKHSLEVAECLAMGGTETLK